MRAMLDEMIAFQEKKLLKLGQEIIPYLTSDDVLQPNDFPSLESHPEFRFEEGVLKGMYTVRAAVLSALSTA